MDKNVFVRLQQFIKFKAVSNNEFGRRIGVSSAQISHMLNGSKFGIDKLLKIVNYYDDLSLDWLLLGKGEMLNSDKVKA